MSLVEILGVLSDAHYLIPFVVLFLCGLGLPLPEEFTLIFSGVLLHSGRVEFVPISLACGVAILLGDSVPYWIGRRWGQTALDFPKVRRLLRPEHMARLEQRFAEHGNLFTFGCRFLMGLRIPGYFVAGTMRMGYGRFLLLDGLGVLITVPISIWLGSLFGDQVDRLNETLGLFHLILGGAVVVATALVITLRIRAGKRAAAKAQAVPVTSAPVVPPAAVVTSAPKRPAVREPSSTPVS